MTLDINGYNATFKAFTDFATKSVEAGQSKAIARASADVQTRPLAGRTITASTTDAVFQAFPLAGLDAESLAAQVVRIVDKTEHWRGILNAFQVAEQERSNAAAEEVLLNAIHGGRSGFIRGGFIRV